MDTKTLLIVEDDEDLLARYQKYAFGLFSPVYTASNCALAKLILREQTPDCIVCDNLLPDGTGLAMIKELRLVSQNMPVVLVTAFADKEVAIESVNSHLFHFAELSI